MKKAKKYDPDLPKKMYLYFTAEATGGTGVPSFSKFARSIGLTLDSLRSYRGKRKKFDKAYAECEAIRRDLIIDGALSKRLDSSFAKYLLSEECERSDAGESELTVAIRVIE